MQEGILSKAAALKEDIITWRRHLHQYPELSFEEVETVRFVKEKLEQLNFDIEYPIAKTGLIATLKGESEGPTVALRADMDALPIQEESNLPYKSSVDGVGHLCGHDAHTAILLGAAHILSQNPLKKGNIKLLFQPAEEGYGGAEVMVNEGALQNPAVDVIAGLHVHPTVKTGETSITEGYATACADSFDIKIIGKGGHAAHPHLSIDPIAIASTVIASLQQVVSRNVDPLENIVLTIGKINGGFARNVIAPEVALEGTVRLLNPNLRPLVKEKMDEYLKGITEGMGGTYEFTYTDGIPSVYNEPTLIPDLHHSIDKVLGENQLLKVKPSMGGEDFSYYTNKIPGVFFRLGTNGSEDTSYPNHHPKFNVDEDALPYGSAILAQFAYDYIENH
ncbi:M20 family metallopeptidase [Jeotgalicoccus sp. ATCC 8456]|uniref:M20 metallopeptidase family protein n=1 Tax=Jeotgalicoccus sp. ATCC 8456 TaxID=946435 RepID=UPI0018E60C68|nr:M20 family metallopeptidase [Jeotgalicoccus sp. ATCC 8456]QQD84796.1 amidohydrolase [Jeotgalicoccus sp. ATCC 8456]